MNFFALVGTLFALVAAIVSVLEASLKQFVEVFIPTDVSDPDDPELSCSIAGLGVYETAYDSSCLEPEVLASSRVPDEKFTAPTTEFKLLFPAQENFVAEVLPVNSALLKDFDAALAQGDGTTLATDALGDQIKAVEALKFDSCEQYLDDANEALTTMFTDLNNVLLPKMVPLVVAPVVQELTAGFAAISEQFGEPSTVENAMGQTIIGSYSLMLLAILTSDELKAFPPCTQFTSETQVSDDLTAGQLQCLGFAYGGAAAQPGTPELLVITFSGLANHFASCAGLAPGSPGGLLSAGACYAFISVGVSDGEGNGYYDPVVFENSLPEGAPVVSFCAATTLCQDGVFTKQGYFVLVSKVFETVANVLSAVTPEEDTEGQENIATLRAGAKQVTQFVQLLGSFLFQATLQGDGTFSAMLAFITSFTELGPGTAPFPSTFDESYQACHFLQLAVLGIQEDEPDAVFETIPPFDPSGNTTCGFQFFFFGAAELAAATENPLAEVIGLIGILFQQCQLRGLGPDQCGAFFPSLFLNGAYQSDLQDELDAFSLDDPDAVFTAALSECEDDQTDKEKISGAQVLIGFAIGVYFLSVVAGVTSLCVKNSEAVVMILAGFLAIGGFALNIGALLQVRSAPVYDAVGEPPEVDDPFYQEGLVVTLAAVCFAFALAGAVLFFAGACYSMRMNRDSDDDDDDEDAEVKKEVANLEAATENAEAEAKADAEKTDEVPDTKEES